MSRQQCRDQEKMMTELKFHWLPRKPQVVRLADDVDYYALFGLLRRYYCSSYLFESLVLPRQQDRYYSMGFDPAIVLSGSADKLRLIGEPAVMVQLCDRTDSEVLLTGVNPLQILRDALQAQPLRAMAATHQGGLIGYFSYEAVNCIEPCLALEEDQDFGLFKLGLYLDGLLFDSLTNELTFYTYDPDRSEQRLAQIQACLSQLNEQASNKTTVPSSIVFKGHSETKPQFLDAVQRTRALIAQGYSFQAEVGFKSCYEIVGDKFAIYDRLRQVNPSPYMFYLQFENGQRPLELLGASPEVLLSQVQDVVLTTPAAGTIHRGKTALEDARLARQLLNDPKEVAEHNMLVDLHRNDLARIAVPGSVKVADLMHLIRFSHVQHIVSNVIGLKRSEFTALDALMSLFPGGVVTGAPKIETIKIIDSNESSPRGPYGGAVGRLSFNGDAAFCLSIRSLFAAGDDCFIQTSAGIVFDSEPEKEFREISNKFAAMKQVLEDLGGRHDSPIVN